MTHLHGSYNFIFPGKFNYACAMSIFYFICLSISQYHRLILEFLKRHNRRRKLYHIFFNYFFLGQKWVLPLHLNLFIARAQKINLLTR